MTACVQQWVSRLGRCFQMGCRMNVGACLVFRSSSNACVQRLCFPCVSRGRGLFRVCKVGSQVRPVFFLSPCVEGACFLVFSRGLGSHKYCAAALSRVLTNPSDMYSFANAADPPPPLSRCDAFGPLPCFTQAPGSLSWYLFSCRSSPVSCAT